MPSSITLSVVFAESSERKLREVYLNEPWQDLMKDMVFKSPKQAMDMEDLAIQTESFIENFFHRKFGTEQGELQTQVYKLSNKAGKELDFGDLVIDHLNPGDTVHMEVHALISMVSQQQQPPEYTPEMIEQVRKMLRFDINDRVLCYCGPRWFSGHVVGTAVPDDELLPYLVKTDPLPGCPSRTISVPSDNDGCCTQEVCFEQLELVRSAAPMVSESKKPKLRFALGDKVVCRIRNDPADGLESWVEGFVKEVWPNIGKESWDLGEVKGDFPEMVAYKVERASGRWLYCHRDDHTLIRRENMKPATRVKGISKRMEVVKEADGRQFRVDHVTERRKRIMEELDDSD
jgi:hypothetical protein